MSDAQIAHCIRRWRGWHCMSQDDVAREMTERGFQWSRTTVAKLEHNNRQLQATELLALLQVFGTGLAEFMRLPLVTNP